MNIQLRKHFRTGSTNSIGTWFSVQRLDTPISAGYASSNSRAEVALDGDILQVIGVPAKTIAKIAPFDITTENSFPDLGPDEEIQCLKHLIDTTLAIKKVVSELGISNWLILGTQKFRIFCLTLFARYQMYTQENPQKRSTVLDEFEREFIKVFQKPQERIKHGTILSVPLGLWIPSICFQRSLFTPYDGKLGIGPAGTKVGDTVAVLLDGNKPVFLRPASNDQYKFVSECYCNPIMREEE